MIPELGPGQLGVVVAVLVSAAVVVGCGSDDTGSGATIGSPVDRGAEVYAQSCASCHGTDLRGTEKGPSHLSIVYEPNHHTDDSFRNAIANGTPQHHWNFGDMEPVGELTDDDVDAVIAYVRAEQERLGFES